MPSDERFTDDAVLRRIAGDRLPLREEDLSPTGPRASAIADRIIDAHRRTDGRRPARRRGPARRRPFAIGTFGLAVAAAVVVLVVTGMLGGSSPTVTTPPKPHPAADVIHFTITKPTLPPAALRRVTSTPLGREIQSQLDRTQEDITTGTVAQNHKAIADLTANQQAALEAAKAVAAVHAKPSQRKLQRVWVRGARLQAKGDAQLVTALESFDAGHIAAGKRQVSAALRSLDGADGFTGWAENGLMGNPGPLPKLPPKTP